MAVAEAQIAAVHEIIGNHPFIVTIFLQALFAEKGADNKLR